MHRLAIAVLALSTAASVAVAQRYTTAGTRGTITAYELDARTVLEHKLCPRTGYTWDYVRCGTWLRDAVKLTLCNRFGSGTHYYYYQVGDSRPMRTSVYCPKRY